MKLTTSTLLELLHKQASYGLQTRNSGNSNPAGGGLGTSAHQHLNTLQHEE